MFSVAPPLLGRDNLFFVLHRNPNFISTSFRQNHHQISSSGSSLFTVRSSSSVQEIEKPKEKSTEEGERKRSSKIFVSVPFPPIRAAKRVVLVRHGQSTWNEEGRIQGSSDFSVLTPKGESQAETSRLMLIDDSFDVCFSSARKEEIITDSDLREIDPYSFQTPNSPIAAGSFGGRKTSNRIILVCHGFSQSGSESQKTAELLLDSKVNSIVSSPKMASAQTADAISRVQEAADCLGADCVPRYVEMKQMQDLDVENILQQSKKDATEVPYLRSGWLNGYEDGVMTALWDKSGQAWKSLLEELSSGSEAGNIIVAVSHPVAHIALMVHCLNLTKEWMGLFHLDAGSISVIDFPDGATGRSVIRCINYTAHLGRWSIPITRSTLDDEEF
ncbi:hypothetical protein LOK49_LG12G01735 [Camellia lanceoleosa]|uniref:Uncharacterized protein n=1 Tax=Camellia lanceoleosa TaxID=1840588 RepID=A0ACC0FTZ5_9ERIC|nr:hypothetical protein LOK49_LG12G01735 [Camellia lanceoleosa]